MKSNIYSTPKAELASQVVEDIPSKKIRAIFWLASIISVLVLFPIGLSKNEGVAYAIGFGFGGMLMAAILSIPFYLFRYFRRPNPKRILFIIWLLFITFFGALGNIAQNALQIAQVVCAQSRTHSDQANNAWPLSSAL